MKDKKKDTNDEDFEQSELSDAPEDDRDCKGDDADEDITYPHLCWGIGSLSQGSSS